MLWLDPACLRIERERKHAAIEEIIAISEEAGMYAHEDARIREGANDA